MSNVYITSDLHLGHKNLSNFRPNGFTSGKQWELSYEGLASLKKRDTLLLLGDVAFDHYWLDRIKDLPCNKILVAGNHCLENGITMKHLVDVYDKVFSLFKYKGHWLSHAPIHPMELRGRNNLHGHTHYQLMPRHILGETVVDERYVNVCQEYTGTTPINWKYAISDEYRQECLLKYKRYEAGGLV